jgi:hypothetical protein
MTEPAVHVSRVRIGRAPGRRAERIAMVAASLVFVAMVKPWGSTAPEMAPRAAPVVAPTPQFRYSDMPCAGRGWLLETDERWLGRGVRTWTMTEGVEATGPSDGRIPFVLVAPRARAVGYCPPRSDDRRPHTAVTFYRLQPAPERIPTVEVTVPRVADASENVLFQPKPASGPVGTGGAGGEATWPPGRYVMEIDGPDGYRRWLGFDVRMVTAGPP